jgi:small subunit ribosomal protein S17
MEQASEQAAAGSVGRKPRRRRIGVVVSDVRDRTITVLVEYQVEHERYGKHLRRRSKVHADDPRNEARVGDRVQLMECRPISKTKSWRLEKILHAAPRTTG